MFNLVKCILYLGLFCQNFNKFLADSSKTFTNSEDPQNCLQELVDWCKNLEDPSLGFGTIVSTTSFGFTQKSILCHRNTDETLCYLSDQPWFRCDLQKNILTYNGKSVDDPEIDLENICRARNIAKTALSFNATEFTIKMDKFEKDLDRDMEELEENLSNGMNEFQEKFSNRMEEFQGNLDNKMKGLNDKLSHLGEDISENVEESLSGMFPFNG